MANLPRMSLHIGDYRKDTGHLRAAGHGAYLLLIMHYWSTGGLPDDDKQLAAIACMTDREWKQWKPVIQAFFHDGWKHKRVDFELGEAERKYQNRAAAGSKGGNARSENKQCSSNATAKSKQPITLTLEEAADADDARAQPESLISPDAFSLWRRICEVLKWDDEVPEAIGGVYTAQKWLNSGWQPDLILTAIQRVMSRGRKAITSLNYFEKAIAEIHAEQQRPVPVAVVNETPEVVNVNQSRQRSGGSRGRFDASDFALSELARAREGNGG